MLGTFQPSRFLGHNGVSLQTSWFRRDFSNRSRYSSCFAFLYPQDAAMGALAVPDRGFTWINRDAENLTSKEHGRAVRAHAWNRRRSQSSRLKNPSANVPRTRFPWATFINVPATVTRRASPDSTTTLLTNTNKITHCRHLKSPLPTFSRSPLSSPFTTQLDPFFSLPCHVTGRDKSLLHLYFSMTPRAIYGTHNNASICPIRDVTAIGVQADAIFLQWIVLGAELYLLRGKASAADQPHILSRKAYIYKLMNKAIADPDTCYSDVTFATMGAAAIASARFESPAHGRRHLVALRKIMKARGGSKILQEMLPAYSISITNCFINIGTEHATFTDRCHLDTAVHNFISIFQDMQTWNQSLRVEFEASSTDDEVVGSKYLDEKLPSVSFMLQYARLRDLKKYQVGRSKVFGKHSFLSRYIPPVYPLSAVSERRCHFAALWIINRMLYDLRHDYQESKEFIERLSEEVTACEIPKIEGDSTFHSTPLKPLAIIYILETVAVRYSPKTTNRGGILHAWDSINPLELMELAMKDSHMDITALLSSWLTNDGYDIFYLTEHRLDEVYKEITTEWLRRMNSSRRDR